MSKVAIITGITGQDGSYLTELLLEKGYKVYGLVRRCSLNNNTWRIDHLLNQIIIQYGDVTDISSVRSILSIASFSNPERIEFYNLAAQSHVQRSFEMPEYTLQADGGAVLHILEEFVQVLSETVFVSIRHPRVRSIERYRRFHIRRRHPFILGPLMELISSMDSGL